MKKLSYLKSSFSSYAAIIIYVVVFKFLIHLLNVEYGFARDELYYLAISERFSFNNLEILPLTPWYLKLITGIFGYSIKAIHFGSAFLGAGAIIFSCLITKELGGKKYAVLLTATTVFFSGFLIFGSFMSYDSIDFLLWTASIYTLVLILKYNRIKLWLLYGFLIGLGLLNKLTIVFMGASVFVALWFVPQRNHFKTIWIWLGGLIAILGIIPFVWWQIKYNWYYLEFAQNYAGGLSYIASLPEFLWNQILPNNIINLPFWLFGLILLLFFPKFKTYRIFGFAYIILFTLCYIMGVKFYFMIPFYTILLSAGSIGIAEFVALKIEQKKKLEFLKSGLPITYIVLSTILLPMLIPILPASQLVKYAGVFGVDAGVKYEYNELGKLPQHFADRFGWEEMVVQLGSHYEASSIDKEDLGIFTANWGQASAVCFYSEKYQLPNAISLDGWFYFETNRTHQFKNNYITIGFSKTQLEYMFYDVAELDIYTHKYCMPHENNKLIYACSNPKMDLKKYWKIAKFINKDFLKVMQKEGISAAISYYHKLKTQDWSTLLFTEQQINALGYEYLGKGSVNEAIELFEFNVVEFPSSSNVYDSLGEAYMINGDKTLAIKNYQYSLALNPNNNNAKKMLKRIESEDEKH